MPVLARTLLETMRITPSESILIVREAYGRCCVCGPDADYGKCTYVVKTTTPRGKWSDRLICNRHGREAIIAGVPKQRAPIDITLSLAEKRLELIRRSGGGTAQQMKAWAMIEMPEALDLLPHIAKVRTASATRDRVRVTGKAQNTTYTYIPPVEEEEAW